MNKDQHDLVYRWATNLEGLAEKIEEKSDKAIDFLAAADELVDRATTFMREWAANARTEADKAVLGAQENTGWSESTDNVSGAQKPPSIQDILNRLSQEPGSNPNETINDVIKRLFGDKDK